MRHISLRSRTAAYLTIAIVVPFGNLMSQATRVRAPADTTRVTALNLSVTSRASWFERSTFGGNSRVLATDLAATPSVRFAGGRIGMWATSAYTPLGVDESAPAWTNAVGFDVRRGSLSVSLSLGQDVGYRTDRRTFIQPRESQDPTATPDTLNFFQKDSVMKGILPPVSGGGSAPATADTSTETTSRAVLVGASTAAVQWTGSRMSARAYYGLALGRTGSRRPLGGADVHFALGATALMFALEQRIAPADREAAGGLTAHVGLRVDAMPWSRRPKPPTKPATSVPADVDVSATFVAEQTERGIRLRLHAPGARQVEVSGNLTSWEAVSLKPDASGWWQVVLPGEKGLHRLRVRVDGGAWTAPAGVAASRDEFGDPVGMVIVP